MEKILMHSTDSGGIPVWRTVKNIQQTVRYSSVENREEHSDAFNRQ